jgi:cation:H+ antiporter
MSIAAASIAFVGGAVVSLATSWVLVTRLERIGARLRASEALLGLVAALAADTPEITSAISALVHHQQDIGVGVVLGSNVFNLAALLGLGAVVAGGIALHRRVVLLEGAIAIWVAAVTVLTVVGPLGAAAGLALVLGVLIPYAVLAGSNISSRAGLDRASRIRKWLGAAIAEEEIELSEAIHPTRGRSADICVGLIALAVVIGASVLMERAASTLGTRLSIPDVVVGTLVLAAVTSLPNAVAGVYLARRGRGAASLSTALNSNALNVAVGLLLPATILGLGRTSSDAASVALWYLGLTALTLVFAYRDRGLRRFTGAIVIAVYAAFVGVVST